MIAITFQYSKIFERKIFIGRSIIISNNIVNEARLTKLSEMIDFVPNL